MSGQHGGHGEEAGVTDPAYPGQSHLSLNLRLQYEQQEGTEDAQQDEGGGQEDDWTAALKEKSKKGSWRGDLLPPLVGGAQMEFQLSGVSLVTLHSHTDTNCSSLHYNFFNVLDDNVLDDDGSAKDKEDHNHDGAHNIADADNNVNNK